MGELPDHLLPAPVGKERLPKEVMEEHQRDRVLAAAVEVFAKRGYQSTTVDHLVAAAQIGVGSFYALFDGKEDCFIRLLDRIVADAEASLAEGMPTGAPWADRVAAGLRGLLELVAAEPYRARVVLVEAHTAGPTVEARYEALAERAAAFLREGRSLEGGDEVLPASLEDATVAGTAWLLHQRLAAGEPIEVGSMLPEMTRIVLEPYVGEEAVLAALAASARS